MQQIHDYIESLMAQGKADPKIRGWSMQDLITQVSGAFGEQAKPIARQYILNKCGYSDE
jgi:hypothetical protein